MGKRRPGGGTSTRCIVERDLVVYTAKPRPPRWSPISRLSSTTESSTTCTTTARHSRHAASPAAPSCKPRATTASRTRCSTPSPRQPSTRSSSPRSRAWEADPACYAFLARLPAVITLALGGLSVLTGLRVPGALHAALVAHLPGVTRLALRKVRFASRADLVALVASFPLLEALSFDLVRFEAKDEGASVGVGAPLPRTLRSLEVVGRVREPLLGW
ncbi:hypothetical protein AcV5_007071 [Taiwanofungus camphoratus]|nr:hypothetical protein AcV5_007071 [Antrodia cinnamomea]